MRVFCAALGAVLLAACFPDVAREDKRYERVLWEHDPEGRKKVEKIAQDEELTLESCYRLAIDRAETLALAGEELVRLETLYEQALASVLPRVSFKGSYTRQDSSGVAEGPFTLNERTEYKVYGKQPIFSGLREFYAIRQGAAQIESKEQDLRHARLRLFIDVAEVFTSVLRLERELETIRDTLRLADERLQELTERQKAGMSRRSEVLAQEAEVASTQAEVERVKGALSVAWDTLRFVTGARSVVRLVDVAGPPEPLAPLDTFLQKALARSDIRSLQAQVRGAEEGIGIARAGWFPTVTLEGTYYTHRAGISEEVDWDVVLSGELPLFDGFSTMAKVLEAASNVRSAELRLQERFRRIRLDVSGAHADAQALESEVTSLEKALASAQENYDLVQAEYRQGIVTNLEVLTSFTTLQRARLERDRARFQLKMARVRLDVEVGTLPGEGRW
ncbi:MAG: TolC family protein [Planctomycetes bacterium]|nr:TolC family protein [Planctomycetota bacterium]